MDEAWSEAVERSMERSMERDGVSPWSCPLLSIFASSQQQRWHTSVLQTVKCTDLACLSSPSMYALPEWPDLPHSAKLQAVKWAPWHALPLFLWLLGVVCVLDGGAFDFPDVKSSGKEMVWRCLMQSR